MTAARDCALGGAILGGQVGYRAIGGPWWAEFALAALVLLTTCLRIVFPQDSPDKLAWWRDRRRTRHRSRATAGRQGDAASREVRGRGEAVARPQSDKATLR